MTRRDRSFIRLMMGLTHIVQQKEAFILECLVQLKALFAENQYSSVIIILVLVYY
jgi:hypothetical protein